MKLLHRLVQVPRQPRDGLDTDRLVRNQRDHSADGAGAEPEEKSFSDEPQPFGRSPLQPHEPSGQEGPLPRPGHPHPQRAPPRHEILVITTVPGIGSLRTACILPHAQVAIPGLEGEPASQVLPTLPGVLGEIAPALLPDLRREMLPRLGPRCSRCHGGNPPSVEWASLRHRPSLHPSSYTQRRLHYLWRLTVDE